MRQYYGRIISLEEFALTPGKDNHHVRMLAGKGIKELAELMRVTTKLASLIALLFKEDFD